MLLDVAAAGSGPTGSWPKRSERGLRPRNFSAGEVSAGGGAPRRGIRMGLAERGVAVRAHHPVELLAWSVEGRPPGASRR